MNILFRCDGGLSRGTGHIMRCLCLAEKLKESGGNITFVCTREPGIPAQVLHDRGIPLVQLENRQAEPIVTERIWAEDEQRLDFEETKDRLNGQTFDWTIIDHYGLTAIWETQARSLGRHILAIDDLANRPHDCDLLLDQNEYTDKDIRYTNLLPPSAATLFGGRYALLRDEFFVARDEKRPIRDRVENILVMMSGADDRGATLAILSALSKTLQSHDIRANVVINPANPSIADILSLAKTCPNIHFHPGARNIAALMQNADLAFGAGGTATWEFCCLGVPIILIPFADNQVKIAQSAAALGFAAYPGCLSAMGPLDILTTFTEIINDRPLREKMHNIGHGLVDGLGAQRVADMMMQPEMN